MKKLRSGYTTGACAAAAAKAAMLAFLGSEGLTNVEIPFPDGKRVRFDLVQCQVKEGKFRIAKASVIKDAGDDPDVTNGAVVEASITKRFNCEKEKRILIFGGKGVGTVTKPGLAVSVGEPAINPVPRKMIIEAVGEAIAECSGGLEERYQVTISMPDGEALAEKTLNKRLGIVGGLSILGTTGIVRPISSEAWTATITASMKVASRNGVNEIVLSTGRTSERAIQKYMTFPDEALVMMGDYLKFSLEKAGNYPFSRIHLAGMWAKILKAAMEIPQTHVRNGALEAGQALSFIRTLDGGEAVASSLLEANTAREIFSRLLVSGNMGLIAGVCQKAKDYCQNVSSLPVSVHLVDVSGRIIVSV